LVSATVNYGEEYAVAVSSEHMYGIQFHPEKSQQNGLTLLSNFVKL
jgi:glutamine amidotransferase